MLNYIDPADGTTFPLEVPRWRSDAGRPLWIDPGSGIGRTDIDGNDHSLWRYRAAFPVAFAEPISLGEGATPMIRQAWEAGSRPLFKLDFLNPTGSFKDRGSSVMLSYLRDHGVAAVLEDSSGNGGASIAGYGAAGGLSVRVFAPATTSPAKIAQVRAYRADVQLVDGPREESQNEAIRQSTGAAFYASHNWQAFFLQGMKTLAYEVWEDLGFEAPDNVIVPVGAGSSLLGLWLGFRELIAAGQVDRLPRLFAAQPLNCSPVDASFSAGTDRSVPRPVAPTIAEGASIAKPLRLPQMIAAVNSTGGGTVAVPEAEIVRSLTRLCSLGMFVEPTAAVAAAACTTLLARGRITPLETTVVLLTGSGLKAARTVSDLIDAGPA